MKTSQRIACDSCGSIFRVVYEKTDSMVRPLFCPMCGESFDEDKDRDWPESGEDCE